MYPTYEDPSPRSARTAWPRHPNPLNTPPALSISSTGQPSRPWIVRWVRQPPGVVDVRSLQELALAVGVPRMDHTALTHWMLGNTMHVGTFMVVQAAVLSSCVIRSDTCENVADAVPGKKKAEEKPESLKFLFAGAADLPSAVKADKRANAYVVKIPPLEINEFFRMKDWGLEEKAREAAITFYTDICERRRDVESSFPTIAALKDALKIAGGKAYGSKEDLNNRLIAMNLPQPPKPKPKIAQVLQPFSSYKKRVEAVRVASFFLPCGPYVWNTRHQLYTGCLVELLTI